MLHPCCGSSAFSLALPGPLSSVEMDIMVLQHQVVSESVHWQETSGSAIRKVWVMKRKGGDVEFFALLRGQTCSNPLLPKAALTVQTQGFVCRPNSSFEATLITGVCL